MEAQKQEVKQKVSNIVNSKGRPIANQFVITGASIIIKSSDTHKGHYTGTMFQSYNSNIAFIDYTGQTFLDSNKWDYSVTTSKYRNQFLGETKKETQAKIDSGEYILTNLND